MGGRKCNHFLLCFTCFRGQIPITSPRGAYIRREDLTEGFLPYEFGGLIFGGAHTWRAYFRNFTVCVCCCCFLYIGLLWDLKSP